MFHKGLAEADEADKFSGFRSITTKSMRISLRLFIVPALSALTVAGFQSAFAADIIGTVTLNGTPPAELVNTVIAAGRELRQAAS